MNYSAVIVAAGKGQRMGLGYNKVFFQLPEGLTILEKTLAIFTQDKQCRQIVVVVNVADFKRCLTKDQCGKVVLVAGGEKRGDSVYNGLLAVTEDKVLIHDGARPFLSAECRQRVVEALAQHQAIVPAVKVKDTIKKVSGDRVEETLARDVLYQVQTPQAFNTDLLIACYKKARAEGFEATDDAQIVEHYGDVAVHVVAGDYNNIKITTGEDLPQ